MKTPAKIQPRAQIYLLRIASKANKTGSKTRFWSKNQTTRTKNKPAFALKIDAYCSKNSWEGADIALKINYSDHYI